MLTVVAQFVDHGGNARIVLKYRSRIDAIARILIALRRKAQELPATVPDYGMISAWSEADSALDPDPMRYMQPYFGNSTAAARGFSDLGKVWMRLGRDDNDAELTRWGNSLVSEAESFERDIQQSIARSLLSNTTPVCLPAIAGVKVPFHLAVQRDNLDPLHRGYRSYMEMLFSGVLTREQVEMIVRYRSAHRDVILGITTAYGYNSHKVAGFLSYGHAYRLLQHELIREYVLMLYSLMAHQYTRGTWTAPETRNFDAVTDAARIGCRRSSWCRCSRDGCWLSRIRDRKRCGWQRARRVSGSRTGKSFLLRAYPRGGGGLISQSGRGWQNDESRPT